MSTWHNLMPTASKQLYGVEKQLIFNAGWGYPEPGLDFRFVQENENKDKNCWYFAAREVTASSLQNTKVLAHDASSLSCIVLAEPQ